MQRIIKKQLQLQKSTTIANFEQKLFIDYPTEKFKNWCSNHTYSDVLLDVFSNFNCKNVADLGRENILEKLRSKFHVISELICNELFDLNILSDNDTRSSEMNEKVVKIFAANRPL